MFVQINRECNFNKFRLILVFLMGMAANAEVRNTLIYSFVILFIIISITNLSRIRNAHDWGTMRGVY